MVAFVISKDGRPSGLFGSLKVGYPVLSLPVNLVTCITVNSAISSGKEQNNYPLKGYLRHLNP